MDTGDRKPGGEGGIRTLDTGVSPYNGLANRRLQPLGHLSGVDNQTLAVLALRQHRIFIAYSLSQSLVEGTRGHAYSRTISTKLAMRFL